MSDYIHNIRSSEMSEQQDPDQEAKQASKRLFEAFTKLASPGEGIRLSASDFGLVNLSGLEIRQLTNEQVANLPGHVLRLWNSAQFSSLSEDQLEALTTYQLRRLTEEHLKNLTQRQFNTLINSRQATPDIRDQLIALAPSNLRPSR